MNFLKMSPWANYPLIDNNNHLMVTTSHELDICAQKLVEIKLGLCLLNLPLNHIVKIKNPHQKYKILTEFWLPSCNELSLTVIAKNPLHINIGETLCLLQLLPIQIFLPGIFSYNLKKIPIPPKSIVFHNNSCCRVKPRTQEKNSILW